jgi:hypothetical protein
MSDITISAPITLPAAVTITAPITIGYQGATGATGATGADAPDTLAELSDVTTYDLPTANTPLADALAAKADSSSLSYVALSGSYDDLIDVPSPSPGVSEVGDLTDATTYDFPTLNTPLVNALAGKSATSHNHAGVYDPAGSAAAAQSAAIQRANHTGAQAISTVTGLQTAIDGKSSTAHTHSNAEVNAAIAASPATSASAMGLGTANTPTFAGLKTTGNVGIGTTAPSATLDIHTATNSNGLFIREDTDGSITHNFYVDSSDNGVGVLYADGQSPKIALNTAGDSYFNGGNVGIGTTSPIAKLHISSYGTPLAAAIQGDSKLVVSGVDGNMDLLSSDDDSTVSNSIGFGRLNSSTGALIHKFGITTWANAGSIGSNTGDRIAFNYGTIKDAWANSELMTIKASGNVGIGTTTPAEKLDVGGNIKASGTVQTGSYTVGTLPLTPSTGMRAQVTDSSVAAPGHFGATVAAGGSNIVPVFYNGTNWIIA